MIKISNIKVDLSHSIEDVLNKVYKVLKTSEILNFQIDKKSLDARKKDQIFYVYSILVEIENEEKYLHLKNVSKNKVFNLDIPKVKLDDRPVVVGTGPAGLFCALILALSGNRPLIFERGEKVEQRKKTVDGFWETGELNINSNVQFGEGGAGTFSDGKLTTGIKDPRCKIVLKKLVECGAPSEIMYLAKPHIGTDVLINVVRNLRELIIKLGGEFNFNHKLEDITVDNGCLAGVKVNSKYYKCSKLVLAIGHSARDTFEMIYKNNLNIAQKAFAMGVRIEHHQKLINCSQYGDFEINSAEYKLTANVDGRGVYTFCMCPGGVVVASSSEECGVVTNGMSYYKRDMENANSAVLVSVKESDFKSNHPLAGMYFQRELEQKCYNYGGGNYFAPAQTVKDFLEDKNTTSFGAVSPTYTPGVIGANLNKILPTFMCDALKKAILIFDKKLKGFAQDAVLTAIESRTSSPIKIIRDEFLESNIKGVYPCGEGAGYAGGIMSAAVDGIKVAEAMLKVKVITED